MTRFLYDDIQTALEEAAMTHAGVECAQKRAEHGWVRVVSFFGVFETDGGAGVDAVAHEVGDVFEIEGYFEEEDEVGDAWGRGETDRVALGVGPEGAVGENYEGFSMSNSKQSKLKRPMLVQRICVQYLCY
jgi:hypothetical protein